ncbi:unnamed protein product [Moneuplotes crassus]|uniref:Uncharacterized protein n=1 Tax=Euplotes crassus TaxID=5936 RepID=A0AAD1UHL8_EUPCR|nr:unnamed protein product [Moneuplotes crassus]
MSHNSLCGRAGCSKIRAHYCSDHKIVLCSTCYDISHPTCDSKPILNPDSIMNTIKTLEKFIDSLNKEARKYELLVQMKELENSLNSISNAVASVKEEARLAIENDEFLKYNDMKIKAQAVKLNILNCKYCKSEEKPNEIIELLFYSQFFRLYDADESEENVKIRANKRKTYPEISLSNNFYDIESSQETFITEKHSDAPNMQRKRFLEPREIEKLTEKNKALEDDNRRLKEENLILKKKLGEYELTNQSQAKKIEQLKKTKCKKCPKILLKKITKKDSKHDEPLDIYSL